MPRLGGGRVRPQFTPHVAFDLQGLYAAQPVGMNGHRFLVAKCDVMMSTRVRRPDIPKAGEPDHWDDMVEVDLRLVHADWLGCPRVEPDEPLKPADAQPWSVWATGSAWWVFHAPSGCFLPVVRDSQEMKTAAELEEARARLLNGDGDE